MLGLYGALSYRLLVELRSSPWILGIVRDSRTRIVHGLEHAAIALLAEAGLPVVRGFTHGPDRYVVVLEATHEHQLPSVRQAATSALDRIRRGEHSLAYHPGCGTSHVVSAVTLWVVCASSIFVSLAIGARTEFFFAFGVIVFRLWLAFVTPLGLLAQRLFTVSTAFTSGNVVDVRSVVNARGLIRPKGETWFEVVVNVSPGASKGAVVAPGAFFV